MSPEQKSMWEQFDLIIRTQQLRRELAEAQADVERHEQWKREDNAWRIKDLHLAEIQQQIPCPQ